MGAAAMRPGWFPVYARAVRNHDKFRGLSLADLGAWCDLRAEVELLGDEPFAGREDAVHVLTRRTSREEAERIVAKLIRVRLLDRLDRGRLAIHDLRDHSGRYPSEQPEATRDRKRASRDRGRESRDVTSESRVGHALDETRVEETRDSPPPPSRRGRREDGTNPRSRSKSPRAEHTNPRAQGSSPRQEREAEKRGPTSLGAILGQLAERST